MAGFGDILAPFLPLPPGAGAAKPPGGAGLGPAGGPQASAQSGAAPTGGQAGATGGAIRGNVNNLGGTGANVTVFGIGSSLGMIAIVLLFLAILFFAYLGFT